MNTKWIDGNHIDVSPTAAEVGMGFDMLNSPVALTKAAWNCCVAWTDADSDRQTHQEQDARLWDVLNVCGCHIQLNVNQLMQRGRYEFRVQCVPRDGTSTDATAIPLVASPGAGAHNGRLIIDICENKPKPQNAPTRKSSAAAKSEHGTITKMLGIAVNDHDAGRITHEHFISILQAAIDNGDILIEANQIYVVAAVLPLLDAGVLRPSPHMERFEQEMNAALKAPISELREPPSQANKGSGCLILLAAPMLLFLGYAALRAFRGTLTPCLGFISF